MSPLSSALAFVLGALFGWIARSEGEAAPARPKRRSRIGSARSPRWSLEHAPARSAEDRLIAVWNAVRGALSAAYDKVMDDVRKRPRDEALRQAARDIAAQQIALEPVFWEVYGRPAAAQALAALEGETTRLNDEAARMVDGTATAQAIAAVLGAAASVGRAFDRVKKTPAAAPAPAGSAS